MRDSTEDGLVPDERDDVLSRVSDELVRAQKRYYGKGPSAAKAYLLDDFLLVVMRGGRTVAEQSMTDFGQEGLVRTFREQFEHEMGDRQVAIVEGLTGRTVLGHQSQLLMTPDAVVELFFFAPAAATAAAGRGSGQ
jgi:uncharacterized protein YbcI